MRLSLPQQDIYFDQILHPQEPIYNIGAKIEIRGILNHGILQKAYDVLIAQNDSFRSIFIKEEEVISSKIIETNTKKLIFKDFSHLGKKYS